MNKEQVLPTLQQQERELQKKRKHSSLEEHFKLFNNLLKLKQASIVKASIMLTIAFIHHILSSIRQYKALINIYYQTEQTVLDSLINACTYFDIQGLLRQDILLNYIMLAVLLAMTFGNTLLYFLLFLLQSDNQRVRKKFIGKAFVLISQFYIWIFHFPAMVVFFENIVCGPSLNCSNQLESSILTSLGALGVFFGTINIFFLSLFFHNNLSQKKDSLNSENTIFLVLFQFYRILLAFFVTYSPQQYYFLWIMMIVQFICLLIFLTSAVFFSGFLAFATLQIRNIFCILSLLLVAINLSMIVDELYRYNSGDQTNENVSIFFIITFIFFSFLFIINLRHTNYNSINFDKATENDLGKQIFIMQQLLEVTNNDVNVDLFFKGILQRHMERECKHFIIQGEGRCFCKKKKIFDSKKKQEVLIDDWLQHKNIFVKFFMKSWIEVKLHENPNSIEYQLLYARFMFYKFQNHQIALHILMEFEKRFLFIINRYKAYQLKNQIMKFVKHKNQQSYKEKLETQNALYVEDQIDKIKQNINDIMIQNCQFWKCLQKEIIDLQELDQLLKTQFNKIEQTNGIWIQISNYLDLKKKWKFYYAWFTLYIQNKKLKTKILDNFQGLQVNENDIFSEELQENNLEEDIASIKSDQELKIDMDKIDIKSKRIVFDKKACIIQATDDPDSLIIKVNRQFTRIFGYSQDEVIQKIPITQLMPDIYSKVHPGLLNDYKLTGKGHALYSQRKIYCIHKTGYMFTAQKFLKLYVDLNGYSQFVVMIRPTDLNNEKKHDVIILNSDWEVQGMTPNIIQSLQINQDIFQKQKIQTLINILLFAPKLIQFSRACQLIDEEKDLQLFGMQKNKIQIKKESLKFSLKKSYNPGLFKIQINPTNSNNNLPLLNQGISSDDARSSFLQMQSLDVPEDKQLFHQASSASEKNEEQDFKQQIDQYSEMQKDLNEQQTKKADEQLKKMYQTQFEKNYNKIKTNLNNNGENQSDDNISRDEIIKTKGQFILEGKINNGEPIAFHMKMSEQFLNACRFYTEQKYKLYQIKKQEDDHVKLEEKQDKDKEKKKNEGKILLKQGTQHREFKKKARLMFQKAAERRRNDEDKSYYELLKEIYSNILSDQKQVKSYKIICTIAFYKIRDERIGIMKISNIQEVLKNRARQNIRKPSFMLQKGMSKEIVKYKLLGGDGTKYLTMTSDGESKVLSPHLQSQNNEIQKGSNLNQKQITKTNGMGYQFSQEDGIEYDEKDVLIESKGQPKMINWDTFQNQFKMQQGTQSFSLNILDNIFRKEDNNKPRKSLIKLSYLSWFLRLMYVSILALNFITYFLKPYSDFIPIKQQAQRIFSLSQMQTYLIEAYDTVMDLLLYKDADFTELLVDGVALKTQENFFSYQTDSIEEGYTFIRNQIRDLDQQQTFLDESIFKANQSVDETINQIQNVTITLDYKDMFTKDILVEHQLALLNANELIALNETNSLVKYIRNITIPTIYNQLDEAVLSLQQILNEKSSSMQNFVLIILLFESGIFIIGFIGLLFIIFWVCQTFKAVLKIFIMIRKIDLNKIVKQQQFVQIQFQYILNKDDEISGILQQNEQKIKILNKSNFQQQQNFLLINELEDQNIIKKKEKVIVEKKLLQLLTIKMSLIYILFVILSSSSSLMFFLTLKNASQTITDVISTGQTPIQDFSDSQLILASMKERYFDEDNYINNRLPIIKTLLTSQLEDIKNTPSIQNVGYGQFYQDFQQIYFNNLCSYLYQKQDLTDIAYQDCITLLDGKLKNGVIAFNQLYASITEDYVLDNISRFGEITLETIWNYNVAIDYIKQAFKALLNSWSDDLGSLIDSNYTLVLILFIVMLVFQLFVFIIIAELYLINQLNTTYQFYRKIYKSYMPNDIIQKEKIIRASLIKYSIIKR